MIVPRVTSDLRQIGGGDELPTPDPRHWTRRAGLGAGPPERLPEADGRCRTTTRGPVLSWESSGQLRICPQTTTNHVVLTEGSASEDSPLEREGKERREITKNTVPGNNALLPAGEKFVKLRPPG